MRLIGKLKEHKQLMRFIETTQKRMIDSEIGNTSVVVAYYLLLSVFPLLIAVGNILPYLKIDPNEVLPYIAEAIPESIFNTLEPAFQSLLTQTSGGLLSISAIAALWSASQSINALQIAMNKAYGVEPRKNFIVVRLVSLFVIILFLVAIVGVVVILGLGQIILEWLQPIVHLSLNFLDTFQALKWPLTSIVLFVIMFLILLVVPNVKMKLRFVIPGAVFATIGWMVLSQMFGIYVRYFTARIAGYQIIGSFIVIMLWLNFAATVVILGGIINAVVEEYVSERPFKSNEKTLKEQLLTIKKKFQKK